MSGYGFLWLMLPVFLEKCAKLGIITGISKNIGYYFVFGKGPIEAVISKWSESGGIPGGRKRRNLQRTVACLFFCGLFAGNRCATPEKGVAHCLPAYNLPWASPPAPLQGEGSIIFGMCLLLTSTRGIPENLWHGCFFVANLDQGDRKGRPYNQQSCLLSEPEFYRLKDMHYTFWEM